MVDCHRLADTNLLYLMWRKAAFSILFRSLQYFAGTVDFRSGHTGNLWNCICCLSSLVLVDGRSMHYFVVQLLFR